MTASSRSLAPSLLRVITQTRNLNAQYTAQELDGLRAAELLVAADPISFAFDASNTKAVVWAKDHAAETVTGISKTTRDALNEIISDALADDTLDSAQLVDDIAAALGDDARAEMIARTETMAASNAGQQEAWDQAVEAGLLSGDELQEWITASDEAACPVCSDMDGEQVGLDEMFEVDGEDMDGPPAHPNCRCTIGLVMPTNAMRAAYSPDQERNEKGEFGGGGDRAAKAKASHVPMTKERLAAATAQEHLIAKALGAEHMGGNKPMDNVIRDKGKITHAIEIKTILPGAKYDKITMHPDSRRGKERFARKNKSESHTVAVDTRGPKPVYYHREGFGSFRLHSMTRVKSLNALRSRVRG